MQPQSAIMFALPREIMDLQLSTLDLLSAMFPSPNELTLPHETQLCAIQLRAWCDDQKAHPSAVPPHLSLTLDISIENPVSLSDPTSKSIQLNILLPLQSEDPEPLDAPPAKYSLRQPHWLSKAEVAQLAASMPPDDIFSAIDHLRDQCPAYLKPASQISSIGEREMGPLVRVWFYFPSLSTREKRDDLVSMAPMYALTGFVLAGKPGVLCLEGASRDIDAYMKTIKTESWGDIPSYQKKVSERYREEGQAVGGRRFVGMQEITESLGERRGERANRGDMKALEAWLKERGLGEAFEKVIM